MKQVKDHPEDLTPEVDEFLKASEDVATKKKAARQQRITSISIGIAALLAVLTIWAIIASFAARNQAADARRAQATAESAASLEAEARTEAEAAAQNEAIARSAAEQAADDAEAARDEANQAAVDAEEARDAAREAANQEAAARAAAVAAAATARSRELAAQANNALGNQTDLAALLAIEAYRTQPTVESKNILLSLLEQSFSRSFQPFGRPIPTQATDVFSVALSPDGTRLGWGLGNGQVIVWNYLDQVVEHRFTGLTTPILGLAFSPDKETLAASVGSGRIILWNLNTGERDELTNVINSVQSLSYNADGSRLAAAMGTSVRIWEVNESSWALLDHRFNDFVSVVAWSPNGNFLAAAGLDRQVVVWQEPLGEPYAIHQDHTRDVLSISWSVDNQTLASGSQDGTVIVWNVVSGAKRTVRDLHPGGTITAVTFSSDGTILATGSNDNSVVLVDADGFEVITRLEELHDRDVNSLAFSPVRGQNLLASGSDDNSVSLLQIIANDTLSTDLTSGKGPILAAAAPAARGGQLRHKHFWPKHPLGVDERR